MAGLVNLSWADFASFPRRERRNLQTVVVHRIEVSQEDPAYADTPTDVARFFREHPVGRQATGGAMPYPLLIDATGDLHQCVPLLRVTPHAVSHNPTAIGLACLGDFRKTPPSAAQWHALVDTAAALLATLGLPTTALVGHDELAGGSRDPDKECPGRRLSMAALRQAVEERLREPAPELALVWQDP